MRNISVLKGTSGHSLAHHSYSQDIFQVRAWEDHNDQTISHRITANFTTQNISSENFLETLRSASCVSVIKILYINKKYALQKYMNIR